MKNIYNNEIISKVNYNNIPQTTFDEVKYRDLSSSEFFNKNQLTILNDILDLYNKANNIESLLLENSNILEYETSYSNMKIKRLESEIENLKEEYETISYNKEYFTLYVYPSDALNTSTAYVDNICNCITVLPKLYEPKTYIMNYLTDETFMPVIVQCNLTYENLNKDVDILKESSNDIQNVFDGSDKTYWFKSVTVGDSFDKVITSLEFEVPDSIITSREVNEMIIKMYPANSVDILNIQYKTTNGSYQQIPNYQEYCMNQNSFNVGWNYDTEDFEILDVDALKLNFENIPVHKIKITISQKYYISNNDNTKTFVFGYKGVELRQNHYNNDAYSVNFVIKFPTNRNILFDSIVPIFTNNSQIDSKKVKFDFYNLYPDGTKTKILSKTPFTCSTNELYVECKLKADLCSPNILKFKTKYRYEK